MWILPSFNLFWCCCTVYRSRTRLDRFLVRVPELPVADRKGHIWLLQLLGCDKLIHRWLLIHVHILVPERGERLKYPTINSIPSSPGESA